MVSGPPPGNDKWDKMCALMRRAAARRGLKINKPQTTCSLTDDELADFSWVVYRFGVRVDRVCTASEAYYNSVPEILASLTKDDRASFLSGHSLPEPIILAAAFRTCAIVRRHIEACERRESFKCWPESEKLQRSSLSGLAAELSPRDQPISQFALLKTAALRNNHADIERIWINLSPEAHEILDAAFVNAARLKPSLVFDANTCGELRKSWVPTPALLLTMLSVATGMVAKTGRPSARTRHQAMADLLDVFNIATAPMTFQRAERGRKAQLLRDALDFIRAIETIFELRAPDHAFLPADEEKEIKKARSLMASFPQAESDLRHACYQNKTVFPPLTSARRHR